MPQAQSVVDTIAQCFDNDTYSDLTIKCHDRSWKVHRVVVCSQSKVLHAACMAGFKEQYIGVVDLDDDDPVAVETMLRYFYTGKYNEQISETKQLRMQLQTQVLTYNLADKYNVPTLMGLAGKRFRTTLNEGPTPEEFLFVVSDVYIVSKLTNALRAIAAEYARAKIRDIMQSEDAAILRTTLLEVPEFAFDIVQLFANAPLTGHCHSCGPNQSAEALQARCLNCGKGGLFLTHI